MSASLGKVCSLQSCAATASYKQFNVGNLHHDQADIELFADAGNISSAAVRWKAGLLQDATCLINYNPNSPIAVVECQTRAA